MKKVLLSAMAAAFVMGIGATALVPTYAQAADKAKVDCTKPENAKNDACKHQGNK